MLPPAVHPHACGEYAVLPVIHQCQGGSSPRVWGILITCSASRALSAVHPHACGEYPRVIVTDPTSSGSSPRVWGIPVCAVRKSSSRRFIPTRVGNTRYCEENPVRRTVHPHACGEYPCRGIIVDSPCGSSPRVWGIQEPHVVIVPSPRFIPTRVGNTAGGG